MTSLLGTSGRLERAGQNRDSVRGVTSPSGRNDPFVGLGAGEDKRPPTPLKRGRGQEL